MTTLLSPEDLLSAVPFLLGFHPEDSLVLIGLTSESITLAMRVDYPLDLDLDEVERFADHLTRNNCESGLLLAYTPDFVDGGEELLSSIQGACELRNITIRESIIIHTGTWRSLIAPTGPQPLPELRDSRIAAEQVIDGRPMPLRNIGEVKNSIAPVETPAELFAALAEIPEIDYSDNPNSAQREGARALIKLTAGGVPLIDTDLQLVALVLVRLRDLQVRDFAMGLFDEGQMGSSAELWKALFRMAPTGYKAPAGCLFAQACYEMGEGALAHRALDIVIEDDSTYSLAHLLRRAFAAGWPPSHFHQMRAELHPKITAAIFQE